MNCKLDEFGTWIGPLVSRGLLAAVHLTSQTNGRFPISPIASTAAARTISSQRQLISRGMAPRPPVLQSAEGRGVAWIRLQFQHVERRLDEVCDD